MSDEHQAPSQSDRLAQSTGRGASCQRGSAFGTALGVISMFVSFAAIAFVLVRPTEQARRPDLTSYDFSSPETMLKSLWTMQGSGDYDALREFQRTVKSSMYAEMLSTLKVDRSTDYAGKRVLFVSYRARGTLTFETLAFEKDASSGLWDTVYLSPYDVTDDKLKQEMTGWEDKKKDSRK